MPNWSKDNFVEALPRTIARLDFNQHRAQHIKNYTAIENVLGKTKLENETPLSFIDLADAPHSYAGHAGKVVTVNSSETGLEFSEPSGGVGVIRESLYIPPFYRSSNLTWSGYGEASLLGLNLYFIPFLNPQSFQTERIQIYNLTSQNLNVRLALYNSIYTSYINDPLSRPCYQPYQKVFEGVNISLNSTNVLYSEVSLNLAPGVYFLSIAGEDDFMIMGYPGQDHHLGMGFWIQAGPQIFLIYGFSLALTNFDDPFPDEVPLDDITDEAVLPTDYIPLIMLS